MKDGEREEGRGEEREESRGGKQRGKAERERMEKRMKVEVGMFVWNLDVDGDGGRYG